MREVELRRALPIHLTWLLGVVLTYLTIRDLSASRLGQDSHAYWAAWHGAMYGSAPGSLDAYNYSPAFAQLIWPISRLPWPAFGVLFAAASVVGLVHLFRPLGGRWIAPLLLCCAPEILTGNVFWLLALVAAYGLRHPALWAVPLLTKLTPALGPVWFAVRGEWRSLGLSTAATLAVVVVSAAIAPHDWSAWLHFLTTNAAAAHHTLGSPLFPPLVVRLPLSLLVVVWGARADQRWVLPVAMALASPVSGVATLTILAAIPRLVAGGSRRLHVRPLDRLHQAQRWHQATLSENP